MVDTTSVNGHLNVFTIIDELSREKIMYPMKKKTKTSKLLRDFIFSLKTMAPYN